MRSLLFVVVVTLFATATTAAAFAQEPGGAGARGVLVLVTEELAPMTDTPGARPEVGFWWQNPRDPAFTATDRVLFEALASQGAAAMVPRDANISRIYRTPNMTLANAAALGGLLGAERVLVGRVEYRHVGPVAPLGLRGVEARASVQLVAAGAANPAPLQRFTLERQIFAATPEAALEEVRRATGTALGGLMARSLEKTAGPVGIASSEQLIGLRNAERAQVLDAIKTFLAGLDTVEVVRERWAAEGIIALEINPGVDDTPDRIEYVLRVLENHPFEGFRLTRNHGLRESNLAEFFVELGHGEGM